MALAMAANGAGSYAWHLRDLLQHQLTIIIGVKAPVLMAYCQSFNGGENGGVSFEHLKAENRKPQ